MARIPLDTEHSGLLARLISWYSRRKLGTFAQPLAAVAHHPGVLLVGARLEMGVSRRWRRLDPTLQCLAVMAAASRIGCSWCMDFGYWEFYNRDVDPTKIGDVPRWRESEVYSELERWVLEYAEAMTDTPPTVTDEMAIVNSGLEDTMIVAYQDIRDVLRRQPEVGDLRTAAFVTAINKVAIVYEELGIFP